MTHRRQSRKQEENMAESYYKPCAEYDRCSKLIEKYWESRQYDKCFAGHMELAEGGYPLAECQVGYFYLKGLGTEKNPEKAFYWTERAAEHGDWDGQYNLGTLYEEGIGCAPDMEKAMHWYRLAAQQGQDEAMEKCREYRIDYET